MKQILNGAFFITGTAVGGGIVLLPAIVGVYGYFAAVMLLVFVWLMNVIIAFIFLEANFYLPVGSSMISMTKAFFGKKMQWITWIICLCFLYTLLCAYIAGISEIFNSSFHIPNTYTSIVSILVVGIPIFFGINHLIKFNDLLVIGMFIFLIFVLFILGGHFNATTLLGTPNRFPIMALPIVYTAFGFTVIVPSLRIYFNNNLKKIKAAFVIGTAIPFTLYLLWITIVMGMIPGLGENSFKTVLSSQEPILQFKKLLLSQTSYPAFINMIEACIFTAFATSLIGISLATYHFLADGLKIKQNKNGKLKLLAYVFVPPFIITATQQQLFLKALGVAGLLSTIAFGVFPLLFVWLARYKYKMYSSYKTFFSKPIFIILFLACLIVIGAEVL